MTTTAVDIVVKVNGGQKLDRLDKQLKGANASVKSLAQGLAGAAGKIAAFTGVAVGLGAAFDTLKRQDFAIAKVKTLGVNSQVLTAELKKVTRELKGQASQVELTAAAYDVASAGFTDAADAAKVLKAASLAATGGFSDINTVGNAATSVLNAYGLSADKAAGLVDKFIQTQNDGKIVVAEYARNIGKVASAAAGLGIPLDEINAAIAQSTASGVQAEVAFTGLKSALARLASGEASKELEKYGIAVNAASLEADGLVGTLKKLVDAGLDTGAIFKVLGTESAPALLPLINNLERTEELVQRQRDSAGAAARAQKEAASTITGALKRIQTGFENLVTEGDGIGKIILPALNLVAAALEALNGPIGIVVGALAGLTLAWYAVAKAASVAAAAQNAATGSGVASAIGLLATKLAILGGGATTTAVGWTAAGAAITKTTVAVKASTVALGALKLALLALPVALITALFTGLALAINESIQKQKEFDKVLQSTDVDEITAKIIKLTAEKKELQAAVDGLQNSEWYRGKAGDIADLTQRVKALDQQIDQATRRRTLVVDIVAQVAEIRADVQQQAAAAGGVSKGFDTLTDAEMQEGLRLAGIVPTGGVSGGGGGGGGGGAALQDDTKAAERLLKDLQRQQLLLQTTVELDRELLQIDFEREDVLSDIANLQGISPQLREQLMLEADSLAIAKEQDAVLTSVLAKTFAQTQAAMDALRPLEEQRGLLEAKLNGNEKEYRIQQEIERIMKAAPGLERARVEEIVRGTVALEDRVKKQEEAEALVAAANQRIAKGIEDGIVAAIDAAINGTEDLGRALQQLASDVLGDLGRMFLKAGIGGIGSGLGLPGFAEGGYVTGPTPALVGEGGEPEYVIPASKMGSAMNRWNAGYRGESIIDGAAAGESGGGGVATAEAPMTVTINGGVMQMNNEEYIRRDQVPSIIDQASKAGERKALRRLQMSPTTRRKLGM